MFMFVGAVAILGLGPWPKTETENLGPELKLKT